MTLRVKLLTATAKAPQRADEGAAGYDLQADLLSPVTLLPGERAAIATGIAVAVPAGCYGRIAPRSGLAVKHGVDVLAGVVDGSYRGHVMAVLVNHGAKSFTVNHGDRVAQLVLEKIATPPVELVADLDATARGDGGFGSTGR